MADLKIRIFKCAESSPETTVTIPGGVLRFASRLIPKQAAIALQEKGIDLDGDRQAGGESRRQRDSCRSRGTQKEPADYHRFGVGNAHPTIEPSDGRNSGMLGSTEAIHGGHYVTG